MNYCKYKAGCPKYWYCDARTNCYVNCQRKKKDESVSIEQKEKN